MNFFQTFTKSLYSPPFYQELLQTRIKSGLLYYLLLILLLSILQVLFSIPFYLQSQTQATTLASQLVAAYPQDLSFTIDKGELTTTAEEPYHIPLPPSAEDSTSVLNNIDDPANMLIIDTKTPYSTSKFKEYDTLAWATKDMLYYLESENDIRSVSYQNIDNFQLNKQVVEETHKKLQPYTVYIAPFFGIAHFLGLLLAGLWRLIYLLFVAAILLVIGKLFAATLTWKQMYKLLLYAVTLPLVITTFLSVITVLFPFSPIPFVFSTLTIIAVIVNVFLPAKSLK